MIRLEDLTLFVRSAALGSFSNAAREANLLPGQVSAAIQRLERELDIRLFARSTRSLRLTAEGEKYLPFAHEMLEILKSSQETLHGETHEIQGEIKIAMPSDIGRNVLLPWITEFCDSHPKLTLRLFLSDHVSDVFRDPVDIAIRYGVTENGSYVALPLAEDNRRVLVAAPRYLEKAGHPQVLEDLHQHHCLLYSLNGRLYDKWVFPENGARRYITVKGRLQSDDADIARRWALEGLGIVYKSWIDVSQDVEAGRLEVLLPEQQGEAAPLHLICPHRKQFSPAIRQLHMKLREHLLKRTALLQTYRAFTIKPA
ncbi:LysR substrate-binding domain-containing protein [Pectobacterium sp. B1J-3]|uniref:LysR family transcriptional regulator n=1 Tax=Pectobacterium sp. B1J-3 TaxID=3385371 RepID=UPI00390598CB